MKLMAYIFFLVFTSCLVFAQDQESYKIKGQILNAANDKPLYNANVININTVKGTVSNREGKFNIKASINDTLYFSFVGFKSMQVKVTEDWIKYGEVKVKMTEVAIALEEVTVRNIKLTGYLEIDAKNIPVYDNFTYQISGLDYGYEGGNYQKSSFSKTLDAIFNPTDLLYNVFGKKPQQMKKLRQMKEDKSIRDLLVDKYNRETLSAVLQISVSDIEKILKRCNYSQDYIKNANDLQLLDAISNCYENYKAINPE
ncbi:carboxypeptidase-like regulatory domain-containing protein [Mesohalobacter halotolerans]|uniref:Carboxypeptidase-like regulatory domain-containing protein n=1 Tax=Mesohalobacter halotolerans TaxID=1883405 RepID=A0A4U5TRL6_9FLAO|nr:carboxypeptidase-like regulatory domain-containing protein [Mesohalobacter halotolerans]MBS3739435.1 carboxypeptidase-like regulatory domain-containing protein [Psychroflexus sp.]TKS55968.1 carboxypeptidase-like regulatory domain-containing protein [Mesohalobacter halotolerans]